MKTLYPHLFTPVTLGKIHLRNRIVMAPMTRSRANANGMPTPLMTTYYQQRASAGLIITEGVYPTLDGKGYCRTPGITNHAEQLAWQEIASSVKDQGGSIVMQLMHCGRIAHAFNKPVTARTVAPSAINAKGKMFTEQGMQNFPQPEALTLAEIKLLIGGYRQAAERAFAAGFDGVELHCTSGYLPAQFLSTETNHRDDDYGGNLQNRLRFVLETLQALATVNGADRVGFRICPGNPFNDLYDENPLETFTALLQQVQVLRLAYLHAIKSPVAGIDVINLAHRYFQGPLIINDGFKADTANTIVGNAMAEAVAFGRDFIANPDLVYKIEKNLPLTALQADKLYTPGPQGYTDYPFVVHS